MNVDFFNNTLPYVEHQRLPSDRVRGRIEPLHDRCEVNRQEALWVCGTHHQWMLDDAHTPYHRNSSVLGV